MKMSNLALVLLTIVIGSVPAFAKDAQLNMENCLSYINSTGNEVSKSTNPAIPFYSPFLITAAGIISNQPYPTVTVISASENQFRIRIAAIGGGDSSGDYGSLTQQVSLARDRDGRIVSVNLSRDQAEMVAVVAKMKSTSSQGHYSAGSVTVRAQFQLSYDRNGVCTQVQTTREAIMFSDNQQTRNEVQKESMMD